MPSYHDGCCRSRTRADNLTEQTIITCRLGIASPSSSYAPGVSTNADILIFDGPEWTVTELNFNNLGTTTSSLAYAVNDATQPYVAGYGTYYDGVYNSRGGWWQSPNFTTFNQLYNPIYRGLSTSPVKLVGTEGNNAVASNVGLNGTFNLPDLGYQFPVNEAWGITADGAVIVGASKNAFGVKRPVTWTGSGNSYPTAVDLGGSINGIFWGVALGVNSAKQVVGQMYVISNNGWQGDSAIRSKPGASPQSLAYDPVTGSGDILHAPGTSGAGNRTAMARSICSSGDATGWHKTTLFQTNSVHWPV